MDIESSVDDDIYVSLLGERTVKNCKPIEYDLSIEALFVDSAISTDFFTMPILLNRWPHHVYDRNTLVAWFQRSNKVPMTGEEAHPLEEYTMQVNIYAAMMLLEKRDEEKRFLFYPPASNVACFFETAKLKMLGAVHSQPLNLAKYRAYWDCISFNLPQILTYKLNNLFLMKQICELFPGADKIVHRKDLDIVHCRSELAAARHRSVRSTDYYLGTISIAELAHRQLMMRMEDSKTFDRTMKSRLSKLSNTVKSNVAYYFANSHADGPLNALKVASNVPLFVESDYFGQDASLLCLDSIVLTRKYLKGWNFIGTSFRGSNIIGSCFSVCLFVGTDFTSCKIENCKFDKCCFYKCHFDASALDKTLGDRNIFDAKTKACIEEEKTRFFTKPKSGCNFWDV